MAGIFQDLQHSALTPAAGNAFGTPITTTGALTSVDMKDAGANRITAMVTCTAVTGAGVATITLQESVDNSTWTTVGNSQSGLFAAISAANTLQTQSFNVTGRYVRGNVTTFTGTSVTIALTFIAQAKMTPANNGGFENYSYPNPGT